MTKDTYQLELLQEPSKRESQRPPLLFVHGVCHGAWCWRENYLPFFARQGWDSCAVSLRGHSGSEGKEELDAFGLLDFMEDVLAAAATLGRKPIIIGHSMGGGITQLTMTRHPDKIAGAMLLASMPPRWHQPAAGEGPARDPEGDMATYLLLEGQKLTPEQVQKLPFFGGQITLDQAARYAELLQTESKKARDDIQALNIPPQTLPIPVGVIGSSRDIIFGADDMHTIADHYGVTARVLDKGCHDLMLDPRWQESAQEILDWLERHF